MDGIRVSHEQYKQMLEHVSRESPMEACGLLGGSRASSEHLVEQVVTIKNAADSLVRFRMDPTEQVQAFFGFEESGWELLAIYHSHPDGPPGPSQIDLREAAYPEAAQLIWFQDRADWICRAYRYERGLAIEVKLSVGSGKE